MQPEVQFVAVNMTDGSLAVMQFVTRGQLNAAGDIFEREATDDAIDADIAKGMIRAASWRRIEAKDVPSDRTFRNAWRDTGRAVVVDMATARGIHRERLRRLRAPLLAALDVDYQRADEVRDDRAKTAIIAKKQALRDVTTDPAIDAAETPEELAAVEPEALRAELAGGPSR